MFTLSLISSNDDKRWVTSWGMKSYYLIIMPKSHKSSNALNNINSLYRVICK